MISLHAVGDVITFAAFAALVIALLYVYRVGRLGGTRIAFPHLWLWAIASLGAYGVSRLCKVIEIYHGGVFYWYSGALKAFAAVVMAGFAFHIWKSREQLALVGRMLSLAKSEHYNPHVDDKDLDDTMIRFGRIISKS